MFTRTTILYVVGLLLVQSGPLLAQVHGTEKAERCNQAEQVLEAGNAHPRYRRALNYLQTCAATSVPAVVRHWDRVHPDTADVLALRFTSRRIRDQRIFDKLSAVAQDRSRPDIIRVGAMLALADYAEPAAIFYFELLRPPGDTLRYFRGGPGGRGHVHHVEGPVPLHENVRAHVAELLRRIGEDRTSEPIAVWYAAAYIARYLDRQIEQRSN